MEIHDEVEVFLTGADAGKPGPLSLISGSSRGEKLDVAETQGAGRLSRSDRSDHRPHRGPRKRGVSDLGTLVTEPPLKRKSFV